MNYALQVTHLMGLTIHNLFYLLNHFGIAILEDFGMRGEDMQHFQNALSPSPPHV